MENIVIISNRDRQYAGFIGAACYVGSTPMENVFFSENEPWDDI